MIAVDNFGFHRFAFTILCRSSTSTSTADVRHTEQQRPSLCAPIALNASRFQALLEFSEAMASRHFCGTTCRADPETCLGC